MKKIFLLSLSFFYLNSYSQIITQEETDEFTKSKMISVSAQKKSSLSLNDNISANNEITTFLNISYQKEKNGNESHAVLVSFLFSKSTCLVQNSSKIMFLLENDEIIESVSLGRTDCNKNLTGAFLLKDLTPFTITNIKKIRIYTSDGYQDITILEEKKKIIKDTFILLNSKINQ